MFLGSQELFRLAVRTELHLLPTVLGAIRQAADYAGLPSDDQRRLEVIVEEACLNVIHHAFDDHEDGQYVVAVEKKNGKLIVSVSDKGLPFDFTQLEDSGRMGIGTKLIRAFADEARFESLGRQGKRVVLVKNLPYENIGTIAAEDATEEVQAPPLPPDAEVHFRLMKPEEAVNVARCLYRGYGYSYSADMLYFPALLRDSINSGLIEPCVAVLNDGTVVGYLGSIKEELDSKISESAQAIVDPRARGRKIFERMKHFIVEHARSTGMYGIYSESVTIHPYTQKGNVALGATELGLLLGFVPNTIAFRQIGQREQREAIVLYYLRVNDEPQRTVYPPFHHAAIITKIYERGAFHRDIVAATHADLSQPLPEKSEVAVVARYEWGHGRIAIRAYGADVLDVVRAQFRDLCLKRIDCIFLDLPMHDPLTAKYCVSFEMMGFFFGGVIPEMHHGDILRLQFLNNVVIDPSKTVMYSEFAQELGAYVLKARENS
jgi:serine/threonine-protein kinase RsbW